MKKIFIYLIVIIVFFISSCSVVLAQDQYILIAKVVDAGEIKESEGLFYQHVRVEIVNGEYKGIMNELQIPFENGLERALGVGDRIKVQTVEINDEIYSHESNGQRA